MKIRVIFILMASLIVLSSCDAIHPSMQRWNKETQSYENSQWYEDQIAKIKVEPAEDGRLMITTSEEEAVKAGVNRRIYRTIKHQVDMLNDGQPV